MTLVLLPAVDVADGQAVRLVQGEAGSETSYGDPVEAALQWQRDGAEWVHLVDLDAAFGRGSNRELLARVVGELDVQVEMSGGIRDDATLEAALATGCARVNLGTAALEQPEWCASAIARHGDRIAVGLDVRGTTLSARGWTKDGGELFDVLARLDAEGCARYVVTDVRRDGTLTGPNLELLRSVTAATDRPVVASGGVSSLGRPHRHRPGARRRGRHRRQGALRRRVHPARGARRRPRLARCGRAGSSCWSRWPAGWRRPSAASRTPCCCRRSTATCCTPTRWPAWSAPPTWPPTSSAPSRSARWPAGPPPRP